MKKPICIYLLILLTVKGIFAQTINNDLFFQDWQNDSILTGTSIGISAINMETGETILQTVPQLNMVPASVLKIVTSAAAIEMLGPDFRFETKLTYSGNIDTISSTLNGNMIILGGGDPALGSMYFKDHYLKHHFIDHWIQAIQQTGIKKINGNIVANATIYEKQMIPNTWIWEDLGNYYGAGASGLSVYDNMYEIYFQTREENTDAKIIKIVPEIPDLKIDNQVKASSVNRDLAYVFGSPFDMQRVILGTIPENRQQFKIKASIPDPPSLLAYQLKQKLEENQLEVTGNFKTSYSAETKYEVIDCLYSPSLKDIVTILNHESVNLFAEHLCKHLAFLKTGKGTTKDGLKIIKRFWQEKGIDINGMNMADGSGLSRFNTITAKQLTTIISYINQSPYSEIFKNSLPTVGGNGTLYVFETEKFPHQSLRAKSGSMTRVRCYAGFLKTDSDQEIIFTIMLNNFSCSQSKAIDKIEDLLVYMKKSY